MDPSNDADLSALAAGDGPEPGAVAAAAVRTASWWLMAAGIVCLGVRLRASNARGGWTLWRLLLLLVASLAVNASVYSAELAAFASTKDAYSGAVPALHRAHIATSNASDAGFIAVLMLLASGYCVTKSAVPRERRPYVFGVPLVLFVSGLVTDYGFYELSSAEDEDDFGSMASGDAAFWFACTLVNLGALLLAWVFIFDILEQEADALCETEVANVPSARAAADARTGASHAHAAAPEHLDQSALPPGTVAFKPLTSGGGGGGRGGGGGAGPSSSAYANGGGVDNGDGDDDEEAQLEAEFRDVMDRIRFEAKKRLLRRLSGGVAAYLVASTAALLLPLFVLGAVQVAVLSLKFLVELAFVGWLVYIFRPVEDSPYLLVGGTAEETEAMGADLQTDGGLETRGREAGGGGGGGGGDDWGAAAAAAVGSRLELQQQRRGEQQQQQHQQLPVSRAMAATEARYSLGGGEEEGLSPAPSSSQEAAAPAPPAPLPPLPPPPPPVVAAPSGGGVSGGGSQRGSPAVSPTRRRPSGPGGAEKAFADVKLD